MKISGHLSGFKMMDNQLIHQSYVAAFCNNCKTTDLFTQSVRGRVKLLLYGQKCNLMLLLNNREVSIMLLPSSGQGVGATKLQHLLLHAVYCSLCHPLLLHVLQSKYNYCHNN